MSALVVALTALGVIAYISGAVIMGRFVYRTARTAACAPTRELELNQHASLHAAWMLALSMMALGVAFTAKDLVQGDAMWQDIALLGLVIPMTAALGMYAGNRWMYFPHMVFGLRAKARGYLPAGTPYDYKLTCKHCGGSSDNLRSQVAAVDVSFDWKCRRCDDVNVVEAAAPCLTRASTATNRGKER